MAVNERLLRVVIAQKAGAKIASRANEAIKLNFQVQKETFLQEFDNHEVTKELVAGPHLEGSKFVHTPTGGNLFSLIGFNESQEPVAALRDFLDKSITVDVKRKKVIVGKDGRIKVEAPVTIPTLQEIYDATTAKAATKVPWNKGKSFVKMIQQGITGFGSYIAGLFPSPKPSKSGGGVQATNTLRDQDLDGIPYLNDLLATFKRSISRKK